MESSLSAKGMRRRMTVLALTLPLMLTACVASAEDESEPPAGSASHGSENDQTDARSDDQVDTPAADAGTASLVMAGESFSFDLAFCAIDEYDTLVHGPGAGNESGEPAYLDAGFIRETSFTTGAARVDLGATEQFQSMDDFYAFSTEYFAGEHTLTIDGESFVLEADFRFADGELLGPATLTVDCR